ncbi:hypothetical protein U1Q18_024035 [Sarracenia purpurea var. burkii]
MANYKTFLILGLVASFLLVMISSEVWARELAEAAQTQNVQTEGKHDHKHGHKHGHKGGHDGGNGAEDVQTEGKHDHEHGHKHGHKGGHDGGNGAGETQGTKSSQN